MTRTFSKVPSSHLGHICHDDANDEDDGLNRSIAHGQRDDEEDDADGDGDGSDEVDKLADLKRRKHADGPKVQMSFHLLVDRSLARVKGGDQACDAAHHCLVPNLDHHPRADPLHHIGGEEGKDPGLQIIWVRAVASERGVVQCPS